MTTYEITVQVENLAPEGGTLLTPVWFGFHDGNFDTYDRGRPSSEGLERLAEDGNLDVISREFDLAGFGTVQGAVIGPDGATPGPIDIGEVATTTVALDPNAAGSRYFNYAAMILPSNDFFIANGNERAHEVFDENGNFVGADFVVSDSNVLDAGTEVNDENPDNTAFFGQLGPDTGIVENGVIQLASGFIPVSEGGNILADPRFVNGDFTAEGYEVARIQITATANTDGGTNTVTINDGTSLDIINFTGVGRGINPGAETLAELDTIQFTGDGLTAENLILTQVGDDLKLTFEGNPDTQVVLKDFVLEQLDNIPTNGSVGNIIFDGESSVSDGFDVFNSEDTRSRVFNRDTVTFLNDLDNRVRGFARSNDVINGQGGNDILRGLSGDDTLRGGRGDDSLFGGYGADTLIGGFGNDVLYLGHDNSVDQVIYRDGDGSDLIRGFRTGAGGDQIAFESIESVDVVANGRTTLFYVGDGIQGNAGFGSGQLLARVGGASGFTADNIGLNIGQTNTAGFFFA